MSKMNQRTPAAAATPFLDKLDAAKRLDAGIFLIDQFLSQDQAKDAFQILNSDFPWDLKPSLYGERLPQHAYNHIRNNKTLSNAGISQLEELCAQIEEKFDGKVSDVYCNRFKDPEHNIPYHTDTFGKHIVVLSLGSSRTVNFRNKKTKDVTSTITPKAGDLYFMPLRVNYKYEHCVCAANDQDLASSEGDDGTRLSFVFFFEPPKYAKEYKLSTGEKIRGFVEGILAG